MATTRAFISIQAYLPDFVYIRTTTGERP